MTDDKQPVPSEPLNVRVEPAPCPFCGRVAECWAEGKLDTYEINGWFVRCSGCGAQSRPNTMRWPYHRTPDEAVFAWNTRQPPAKFGGPDGRL